MMQAVWLGLGLLAALTTAVTLYAGLTGALSAEIGIVTSAIGVALWALVNQHSTEVTVADGAGGLITNSYPSIGALALVFAALMFVSMGLATMNVLEIDNARLTDRLP